MKRLSRRSKTALRLSYQQGVEAGLRAHRLNLLTVAGAALALNEWNIRTDFPFNPLCGHLYPAHHIFGWSNRQALKYLMAVCELNWSLAAALAERKLIISVRSLAGQESKNRDDRRHAKRDLSCALNHSG
jgi:hypothetical protein